jgi:two-component system nitrogen regulation sensor histidine kinase NtrY
MTNFQHMSISWFNLWEGITKSFYRKLLALLIIISIIPMIFLSLSIRNYLSDRLIRQIKEEGIATAEFAKRAMEDYLFAQGKEKEKPEDLIDDNLALLISSWANRDIHIFINDYLAATNKRELFSAGFISPRIDDDIYYQLALARQPYYANQYALGDFSYLVISVPIELPTLQKPTILSTPLMIEQRQVEIEIAEINDAIFIATVLLIIFCSFLSYSIAKKVSGPIKKLTQSTYQISEGNFDLYVTTRSKDEMKELVESFNLMAKNMKQQQLALRGRKEYIEQILLNAPTGVLSLDDKGIITTINPAAVRLLLLRQKKLVGLPFLKLIANSTGLKELKTLLLKYLKEPQRQLSKEIQIERFGQKVNLRIKFLPLKEIEKEISGSIVMIEDITDVINSNRLATWAEMARIIAHEIKNPLTPIQLSAEHLRQVIKDQPKGYRDISDTCIESILNQVELLRQLSIEFSHYAKLPQLKLSNLNIRELINNIIHSYGSLQHDKYELKIDLEESLPLIQGDKELLRRALINIVENSLEAMPEGGTILIKARLSRKKGLKGIKIEISDTGTGIDRETLKRLFEPYFSTKDSGVGLGLAITKKSIEEHEGEISVKSSPQRGTKITIWLPAEK